MIILKNKKYNYLGTMYYSINIEQEFKLYPILSKIYDIIITKINEGDFYEL